MATGVIPLPKPRVFAFEGKLLLLDHSPDRLYFPLRSLDHLVS